MTVEKLIEELKKFPKEYEVYSLNEKGIFLRVERIDKDDNYDDLLVVAGDVE